MGYFILKLGFLVLLMLNAFSCAHKSRKVLLLENWICFSKSERIYGDFFADFNC
jgi:hypothetical protein